MQKEQICIVYGYIRQHKPLFPEDIIQIIYNFYFLSIQLKLSEWLPQRKTMIELETQNVVPHYYFDDPIASMRGSAIVRQMISSILKQYFEIRPTFHQLQMRNIIPQSYTQYCNYNDAYKQHMQQKQIISKLLNEKLSHKSRPTIIQLCDNHIIPQDYLDNVLQIEISNHQRHDEQVQLVERNADDIDNNNSNEMK
eukprot:107850_1